MFRTLSCIVQNMMHLDQVLGSSLSKTKFDALKSNGPFQLPETCMPVHTMFDMVPIYAGPRKHFSSKNALPLLMAQHM